MQVFFFFFCFGQVSVIVEGQRLLVSSGACVRPLYAELGRLTPLIIAG